MDKPFPNSAEQALALLYVQLNGEKGASAKTLYDMYSKALAELEAEKSKSESNRVEVFRRKI